MNYSKEILRFYPIKSVAAAPSLPGWSVLYAIIINRLNIGYAEEETFVERSI